MEERFLPPGTYTVIVPTPEVREIAGDDPGELWADVYAQGSTTCCATFELGEAGGDDVRGWWRTLPSQARGAWQHLLFTMRDDGAKVEEITDPCAIACVRVVFPPG